MWPVSRAEAEATRRLPEEDCSAHPETSTIVLSGSERADCKGKDQTAISEGENPPLTIAFIERIRVQPRGPRWQNLKGGNADRVGCNRELGGQSVATRQIPT